MESENCSTKASILAIPLAQAVQQTKNWRDFLAQLKSHEGITSFHDIRAFNLTLEEVRLALFPDGGPVGERPVSARMYLGCTSTDPRSDSDFKLIIVGVNEKGEDVLTRIGDFSNPCPTFCDPKSPLNSDHPDIK